MTFNKTIESFYLKETSIIDILLTILLEGSEYSAYFQSIIENISDREEISHNE